MQINEEDSFPKIWNPSAAVNWSVLLTPAFGPVLHYLNWKRLGETQHEKTALIWAAVFCFLVGSSLLTPIDGSLGFGFLLAYILMFVWYFVTARKQIRYVDEKFGKTYPRREWFEPLMIAGLILGVSSLIPF